MGDDEKGHVPFPQIENAPECAGHECRKGRDEVGEKTWTEAYTAVAVR